MTAINQKETPMEYFIAKGYSYALQRNVKFKLGIDPEATPVESLIKAEATARDFLSKIYGLIGTITVVKSEAQK